jgi:hypothetical protein
MSDVKDINENKKASPVESGINNIREAAVKAMQSKVVDKIKAIRDAQKVCNTLKGELKDLLKEQEVEKGELNDLLKELK